MPTPEVMSLPPRLDPSHDRDVSRPAPNALPSLPALPAAEHAVALALPLASPLAPSSPSLGSEAETAPTAAAAAVAGPRLGVGGGEAARSLALSRPSATMRDSPKSATCHRAREVQ